MTSTLKVKPRFDRSIHHRCRRCQQNRENRADREFHEYSYKAIYRIDPMSYEFKTSGRVISLR